MKESYSKKRVKLLKQNKDYDALYRYCSRFALDKNWDAFLEVSKCYMHGWGVEKNPLHDSYATGIYGTAKRILLFGMGLLRRSWCKNQSEKGFS